MLGRDLGLGGQVFCAVEKATAGEKCGRGKLALIE